MIVVIHAHPYPSRSRACAALLAAADAHPAVEVRRLYEFYPDFDIDVAAERGALESAGLLVWLHPLYWNGPPALLKHWLDQVLAEDWVRGGGSLAGKDCLWAATTGGEGASLAPFEAPMRETATYCGMNWLAPFHAEGLREATDGDLSAAGERFRARLDEWSRARGPS